MVALVFILNNMMCFAFATDVENYDYVENMSYVFNYWDAYTDSSCEEYTPPSYFAGFIFDSTKMLTVCITEDSTAIRQRIMDDCGGTNLQFQLVDYSFNDLLETQRMILSESSAEVRVTTISIPNNTVNVYVNSEADYRADVHSISGMDKPAVNILPYVSDTDVIESTHNISVESIVESTGEPITDSVPVALRTTSSFYPGQRTRPMGSSGNGTVGFCATDSSGRQVVITHGHTYIDSITSSTQYTDCLTAKFGTDSTSYPVYILSNSGNLNEMGSVDKYLDAAYIPVSGTISNTMPNGVKLTGAVYTSQLSSVSNISGAYYGYSNGLQYGTITVADSSYLSMTTSSSISSGTGDSGGPIYLTNTSQNRLVGIVKSHTGSNLVNGILWTRIASAYATCTGKTLAVRLT